MKYAIVESGGKQYKAVEGATIEVDKLPYEVGDSIQLDQVLLVSGENGVEVGTPVVKGSVVKATVLGQVKGEKVIVFHYRPKERIRTKTGHRQQYTRLQIDSIVRE
ncbi:MAG: 50S ribosomal protein L21 [Anaerolineae bacterium]|nr:50S ribosomal protein L21 [Anaerolineae bacterium]